MKKISSLNTIAVFCKVLFVFLLLYAIIPSRIINFADESQSLLDKFFISMIHSSFITIILVHFLIFLSVYETISLLFMYFVVYVGVVWYRGRSPAALADALGIKVIVNILDMSEGRLGLRGEITRKAKERLLVFKKSAVQAGRSFFTRPFAGFFLLPLFILSAYIRFKHSLLHLYLGASDSYVNLAWAKYMGTNKIYYDGIYPHGYHALISALQKLFFVDPYYLLRFIGPLAGFLIVLSLYYVLKKNFKDQHMIWLGVLLYGVMIDTRLPADVWRQMSSLAMEYGAVFFLPGLHFFNMYFKHKNNDYLFLAGECVALTLLIHPYVTVFLGIGYIIIFVCHICTAMSLKRFFSIAGVMVGSIILGVLPLLVAYLMGMKFHGSLGYIEQSVTLPGTDPGLPIGEVVFREENPFFLLLLGSSVVYCFSFLLILITKKRRHLVGMFKLGLAFVFLALSYYVLFRARNLGLPELMDTARIGIFLSIIAVVVYALALQFFDALFPAWNKLRYGLKSLTCLIVLLLVVNYTTFAIPRGFQMEYDEAVEAYLIIKRDFPALNWTVISPVEQYQQCMGYGWHYELWEFVEALESLEKEELLMTTDYVFFFVEKVPLGSDKSVSRGDAEKPFPPVPELISNIYSEPESRRIIEAKAYYWAENYRQKNDNMRVFLDNDFLRVYLLEQDGLKPVNLLKERNK